jgi:hypothetical protein
VERAQRLFLVTKKLCPGSTSIKKSLFSSLRQSARPSQTLSPTVVKLIPFLLKISK